MNRRDFSIQVASTGLGLGLMGSAQAQAPIEGTHFVKLSQRAPVSLPSADKKLEVVEFFWYECPHCFAFEPLLDSWVKKMPPDIAFRRVPVGFTARHQIAQRLFYALEEMGQLAGAHRRIFSAIHDKGQRLTSEADAVALATGAGVDGAKFTEAYKSFGVNTKASRARQLHDAYKIDGVPALGIDGRYFTSAALAGGHERAVAVAEFLIDRSRKA
jgi:thiol:disulfide interchange protein DsbA